VRKKTPKIAPFPWDFVTPPEEDRATAIGNMQKNSVKITHAVQGISSRTDRQTHRKLHWYTHIDKLITILSRRSRGNNCSFSLFSTKLTRQKLHGNSN